MALSMRYQRRQFRTRTPIYAQFFSFSRISFTVSDAALWKIFDVADRCRKMICTGRRMTRESCIRAEFICKQRWEAAADRCRRWRRKRERNGVVGCVLTKLARNYFQPGTSVATGKIGFYVFIARTVCAGKISLEFAQEFSSTRPSVANSSRETSGKKINLIIRIKSHAFRVSLNIYFCNRPMVFTNSGIKKKTLWNKIRIYKLRKDTLLIYVVKTLRANYILGKVSIKSDATFEGAFSKDNYNNFKLIIKPCAIKPRAR